MGDFNMSCALSGLTIKEGDKIGFIMLKFHYPEHIMGEQFMDHRIGTVYSHQHYVPFLPIVFGEYNNYGRFHHVKKNVTTGIMKDVFRKSVSKVISAVGNSSRSVYYDESPLFKLYKPQQVTDVKLGYNSSVEEGLLAYGFEKNANRETSYVFGDYTLFQEGNDWFVTTQYNNRSGRTNRLTLAHHSREYDDVLDAFGRLTRVFPGFNPSDYRAIHELINMSGMVVLEEVYTKMMEKIKTWDDFSFRDTRFRESWEEFNAIVAEHTAAVESGEEESDNLTPFKLQNKLISNSFAEDLKDFLKIDLLDVPILTRYYGTEEIFHAYKTPGLFQAVNRMIEPSLFGEQYGNHEASTALHDITGDVLVRRTKEREENGY